MASYNLDYGYILKEDGGFLISHGEEYEELVVSACRVFDYAINESERNERFE